MENNKIYYIRRNNGKQFEINIYGNPVKSNLKKYMGENQVSQKKLQIHVLHKKKAKSVEQVSKLNNKKS